MIRVLVASDGAAGRRALSEAIARDGGLEIVAETAAFDRATAIAVTEPDVIVIDARDLHVAEATDPPAVVIGDEPVTPEPAGAHAILTRDASSEEIVAAIRAVAAGLVVRQPAARGAVAGTTATLSSRERDVLAQLASGASNKRIAASLGISDHTVKTHIATIFAKLGVSSRTEAVTRGVRLGLVML